MWTNVDAIEYAEVDLFSHPLVNFVELHEDANSKEYRDMIEEMKSHRHHGKDHLEAEKLKNIGNRQFMDGNLDAAAATFTAGLVVCPWEDQSPNSTIPLIAIFHANRAAVFAQQKHWQLSMLDAREAVERCRNYGKGWARLAEAEYELHQYDAAIAHADIAKAMLDGAAQGDVDALIIKINNRTKSPPDMDLPPLLDPISPDMIVLNQNEMKGRYLVCKDNTDSGRLLVSESPVCSALLLSTIQNYCSHCLNYCYQKFPCRNCVDAVYCSVQCRDDNLLIHQNLCCCVAFFVVAPVMLRLAAILQYKMEAGVDDVAARVVNNLTCPGSSLPAHKQQIIHRLVNFSCKVTSFGKKAFHSILMKAIVNAHVVSTLVTTPTSRIVSQQEQKKIGIALYDRGSMLNHSCVPNCLATFHGGRLEIRSSKPLESGSELTISYGPMAHSTHVTARKQILLSEFYFDCNCDACKNENENVVIGIRCPKCASCVRAEMANKNAIDNGDIKHEWKCTSCPCSWNTEETSFLQQQWKGNSLTILKLKQMVDKTQDGSLQYQEMLEGICQDIKQILQQNTVQLLVQQRAQLYDLLALSYTLLNRYDEAFFNCQQSIQLISSELGGDSLEVATEKVKIAQLAVNCGMMDVACRTAKEILPKIVANRGSDACDVHSLVAIINTCQNME